MRVTTSGGFAAVEDFVRSGMEEATIELTPPSQGPALNLCRFKLRAVRRDDAQGNPQVFLTSLPSSPFPRADIIELYSLRWQVELLFRLEKSFYFLLKTYHLD